MIKYKVKIITGFDADQKYSIDAEEAHKAYYLFLNPEKRGVFKGGVAIIGKNIDTIAPDYHGTMGWNQSHKLDGDDWKEIKSKNIDQNLETLLEEARVIGGMIGQRPELASLKLSEATKFLPEGSKKITGSVEKLANKLKTS